MFVAIVYVLTNDPQEDPRRQQRGPSLRILFVTFFVFLVASFLWGTLAGFPTTTPATGSAAPVAVAVQPVLGVPAAWLLSEGAALLFFAISWLVWAYEDTRGLASSVSATAVRCFRLIAWLVAVELWIAVETATRALAGRGWWYSPAGIAVATVVSLPFVFADHFADRTTWSRSRGVTNDSRLGTALGYIGVSTTLMVAFFAVVTGQPDSRLLREGHWCGSGLPWWAGASAIIVMALFLGSIAALACSLPPNAVPLTPDEDTSTGSAEPATTTPTAGPPASPS